MEGSVGPIDFVRLRLDVTPTDLTRAYQLHARAQLWSRAAFVALSISLALVAALCFVTIGDRLVIAAIILASLVGGLAFPRAMIRWRVPVVAGRIYRQQRSLREVWDVVCDAESLRTTSETGFSSTPWSHYTRLREDVHLLLFYHSDALFQMVPKRLLSEAQLAVVRQWFAAAQAHSEAE